MVPSIHVPTEHPQMWIPTSQPSVGTPTLLAARQPSSVEPFLAAKTSILSVPLRSVALHSWSLSSFVMLLYAGDF